MGSQFEWALALALGLSVSIPVLAVLLFVNLKTIKKLQRERKQLIILINASKGRRIK